MLSHSPRTRQRADSHPGQDLKTYAGDSLSAKTALSGNLMQNCRLCGSRGISETAIPAEPLESTLSFADHARRCHLELTFRFPELSISPDLRTNGLTVLKQLIDEQQTFW